MLEQLVGELGPLACEELLLTAKLASRFMHEELRLAAACGACRGRDRLPRPRDGGRRISGQLTQRLKAPLHVSDSP